MVSGNPDCRGSLAWWRGFRGPITAQVWGPWVREYQFGDVGAERLNPEAQEEPQFWAGGGGRGAGSRRRLGKGGLVLEPWFGGPWAQESWLRVLLGCSPGTVLGLHPAQNLDPPGRWSSVRRRSSCGASGGLRRTHTCLHRVLKGGWRLALWIHSAVLSLSVTRHQIPFPCLHPTRSVL